MKSGKALLGYKSTLKSLRQGKCGRPAPAIARGAAARAGPTPRAAKLVLISNNCPPLRKSEIEYYAMLAKTGVHHYSGSAPAPIRGAAVALPRTPRAPPPPPPPPAAAAPPPRMPPPRMPPPRMPPWMPPPPPPSLPARRPARRRRRARRQHHAGDRVRQDVPLQRADRHRPRRLRHRAIDARVVIE